MTNPYPDGPPYQMPQQPMRPPDLPSQYPPGPNQYPISGVPYQAAGGALAPYHPSYPVSVPPHRPIPPTSAAPYGLDPLTGRPLSDKSKVVAALLQIFLSGFAAGRLYTGHAGLAVGQIAVGWGVFALMGCLGFFLLVPWLFCWVGFMWPFIDGIVILSRGGTDAQGRVLRSG